MTLPVPGYRRRLAKVLILLSVGASMPGFLTSCGDTLIGLSRYVDPCGTILGNCAPGDLEVARADVGDYCVDPACTVPGQCGAGQPLGTITNICP